MVRRKPTGGRMWGGCWVLGDLKDGDSSVGQDPAPSSASVFRPSWMVGMKS